MAGETYTVSTGSHASYTRHREEVILGFTTRPRPAVRYFFFSSGTGRLPERGSIFRIARNKRGTWLQYDCRNGHGFLRASVCFPSEMKCTTHQYYIAFGRQCIFLGVFDSLSVQGWGCDHFNGDDNLRTNKLSYPCILRIYRTLFTVLKLAVMLASVDIRVRCTYIRTGSVKSSQATLPLEYVG